MKFSENNREKQCGLAMASVPKQSMDRLYEPQIALQEGTIFCNLNYPFFASKERVSEEQEKTMEQMLAYEKLDSYFTNQSFPREEVMQRIYQVSFFLNDLVLYLDTHPDESDAIALFAKFQDYRNKLLQRMEVEFSLLTLNCIVDGIGKNQQFSWTEGPIPWEGVC